MSVWEVDFYRRPLNDEVDNPVWELLLCDPEGCFRHSAFCPQPQATANWLMAQFQQLTEPLPQSLRVFRPQTFNLLESVCRDLNIALESTRQVSVLKQWLQERSQLYPTLPGYTGQPYQPLELDKPPPVPLPENLWGDRWRFAALPAAQVAEAFAGRMIPFLVMPEAWLPLKLGLASTVMIPGVVIDGGRQSLRLAQWIQKSAPATLSYVPGAPNGLVLEAGLVDRWVVATFEDAEVAIAAAEYEQRKRLSQGLHFLLVQPDDSGMTYTGFWLLQSEGAIG